MKTREIKCKSILTKSRLPACDYVINPYTGCSIGCVYCYSRFMKRFTGHKEPWGQFVDVKINALEVLQKEIKNAKRGLVFISSVTDAYQPIEAKYKLTRSILEILLEHQFPVSILTKSPLILRDTDLFKKFKDIIVGVSITSLDDDKMRRNFEPGAAVPKMRFNILKTLYKNKIKTYAHIGPIMPYFTNLPKIFSALNKIVDEMWLESLNTTGANWRGAERVLKLKYPKLFPMYKELFFTSKKKEYIENLRKDILELGKKHKIKTYFFVHR